MRTPNAAYLGIARSAECQVGGVLLLLEYGLWWILGRVNRDFWTNGRERIGNMVFLQLRFCFAGNEGVLFCGRCLEVVFRERSSKRDQLPDAFAQVLNEA